MDGENAVSVLIASTDGWDLQRVLADLISRGQGLLESLVMPSTEAMIAAGIFFVFAVWVTFSPFWSTLGHGILNALDLKKGLSSAKWLNWTRGQLSGYFYFAVRRAEYPVVDIIVSLLGLVSSVVGLLSWVGIPVSRWFPVVAQLEPTGILALAFAVLGLATAIFPPVVLFFNYRKFQTQKIYQLKRILDSESKGLPHVRAGFAGADYDIYPIVRRPEDASCIPDDVIFWDHRVSAAIRKGKRAFYSISRPKRRGVSAVLSTRDTLAAYVDLAHVKDIFDALRANINNAVKANRSFTNDRKIKLDDVSVDGGAVRVQISKTDYYTSEITNKTLSKAFIAPQLDDGNRVRHDFRQWMPFVREAGTAGQDAIGRFKQPFELLPLSQSRYLSNHVGGVHLALSRDGYPLLAYQSRHSHESANSIVTNGCGSMDWADLNAAAADGGRNDFLRVLQRGHARELLEETGAVFQDSHRSIDRQRISAYSQTVRIAGFYRSLNWGGLPLFVGFSRHFLSYQEILGNYDRKHLWIRLIEVEKLDYREYLDDAERSSLLPIRSAADFVRFFDAFVVDLPRRVSVDPSEKPPTINTQLFLLRTLLANQKDVIACFDAVAGTEQV